jgi:hypothetical protein
MAISQEAQDDVLNRWVRIGRHLDERQQRLWAATEADVLGYGGVSLVAKATGLSRPTIHSGLAELKERTSLNFQSLSLGRKIRRSGAGRKTVADNDPSLIMDLRRLVDPVTRGDPESPLLWTCKSLENLAKELREMGHDIKSATTVGKLLKIEGYTLQGNAKTQEGADHPDRNEQFEYINAAVRKALKAGEPAISVDAKKKELVGTYKNPGREWQPQGEPEQVNSHDFLDEELGRVSPYGIYDIGGDTGWVNVGVSADTAEFAVASVERWWYGMGETLYPRAKEILITADSGGSNGYTRRFWKLALQNLADEIGLTIRVCHFPPGTSKWNKIEHRLFSRISMNWRGRPLISHEVIVNLIGATRTRTGLKVHAELDTNVYVKGIEIPDDEFAAIRIEKDKFHGEWNYAIKSRTSE